MRRALAAAIGVLAAGLGAQARAAEQDGGTAGGAEPDADAPEVILFGRILARASADQRSDFDRELGISQARLGMRAKLGFADAVVQADIADAQPLKDAYLRVKLGSGRVRLYGGNFKAPFLARELQSTWKLPRVGRGLVESFVIEDQMLAGRRLGAMAEYRPRRWGLSAQVGLFQGAVGWDGQRTGEDLAARVAARPWKALALAGNAYFTDVASGGQRLAAGAAATLKLRGFGVTAEGTAGRVVAGHFASATALGTYDVPFGEGAWVGQPVLGAEVLQLRGERAGVAFSSSVGANLTYRDQLRAQLQLERAREPGEVRPACRVALQLGAHF